MGQARSALRFDPFANRVAALRANANEVFTGATVSLSPNSPSPASMRSGVFSFAVFGLRWGNRSRRQGGMKTRRPTAAVARTDLHDLADPARVATLQRFFKTGPGEYAEGDVFLGVKVPQVRKLTRTYTDLPLKEVQKLLRSRIHEERLLALLILVRQYTRGNDQTREQIFSFYVGHFAWINNWDLIDVTAPHIAGAHLANATDRSLLDQWARSNNLWSRRIAMLSTFHLIQRNQFTDALRIAELLVDDTHDLIQKAVGWMVREIGKRDRACAENFLKKHYKTMPRTMLRYAIERLPESRRQAYLRGMM